MRKLLSIMGVMVVSLFMHNAWAQGETKTPFEYPVAPDTCSTLESRCNYIVVNFWNNYDISKPITDGVAFEKAFRDYVDIVKLSHRNIALSSVRDFIYKARANVNNLRKVGVVAEAALYGPYAEFWSDELYVEVARAMSESTNLKTEERKYYKHQIDVINKCQTGQAIPDIDIVVDGRKTKLSEIESCPVYLLFFTDGSSNSSMDRTRLSTDINANAIIEASQLKVIQIYVGKPDAGWSSNQPTNWINATSEQVAPNFDVRFLPSCFILDKDLNILNKNITVEEVKQALGS